MTEQKPTTTKSKYKSYAEAKEAFDKFRGNQKESMKRCIVDMIEALKAEGQNQDQARKILEKDLRNVVDRSYISRLCKQEYMTPAEQMAEEQRIENLNAEQKKREAQAAQIIVGEDGNTQMIYESGDNDGSTNSSNKGIAQTREEIMAENNSRKIKAASNQVLEQARKQQSKDTPAVDSSELNSIPDDQFEQIGNNMVIISNQEHINQLKNALNLGKEIVISVNNDLVPLHIGTGDPLH